MILELLTYTFWDLHGGYSRRFLMEVFCFLRFFFKRIFKFYSWGSSIWGYSEGWRIRANFLHERGYRGDGWRWFHGYCGRSVLARTRGCYFWVMGKWSVIEGYPLVNVNIAMENHHAINGKPTISMAIFNSYVTNYQRVSCLVNANDIGINYSFHQKWGYEWDMNGGMDGEIGAVGSNLGRYLMSIDKPSPILNNLWDQMGIYTYIYIHITTWEYIYI